MPQGDCFCIFNTDIEQVTTETATHRFLIISINKYDPGHTKISIVKKFLIISDNLSEKEMPTR